MDDFVTLLTCADPPRRRTSKCKSYRRLEDGTFVKADEAKFGFEFLMKKVSVSGLDDIERILRGAHLDPYTFIVQGEPIHDDHETVKRQRLLWPKHPDTGTIRDRASRFLALDIDKFPLLPGLDPLAIEPLVLLDLASDLLPPELLGVDCIMRFSNGHGLEPGKVRFWLYYELDRPLTCAQKKAWFIDRPVDHGVLQPVQPNLIHPPSFVGCDDPIPERIHRLQGEISRIVRTPPDEQLCAAPRTRRTGKAKSERSGQGGASSANGAGCHVHGSWQKRLHTTMGEQPAGHGFHIPIAWAVAKFVHDFGPDADPTELFEVIDRLLDERAQRRGAPYIAAQKQDARGFYAKCVENHGEVKRRQRKPRPTVSLPEGEELVRQCLAGVGRRVALQLGARNVSGVLSGANKAAADALQGFNGDEAEMAHRLQGLAAAMPGQVLLKASLGIGKTEEAFKLIGDVVALGGRVAMFGNEHRLLEDLSRRLTKALPHVRHRVYLGETQLDPEDPKHQVCRHASAKATYRGDGGDAEAFCRRCPLHERQMAGKGAGYDEAGCYARRQRHRWEEVQVALMAGSPMLTHKPFPWLEEDWIPDLVILDDTSFRQCLVGLDSGVGDPGAVDFTRLSAAELEGFERLALDPATIEGDRKREAIEEARASWPEICRRARDVLLAGIERGRCTMEQVRRIAGCEASQFDDLSAATIDQELARIMRYMAGVAIGAEVTLPRVPDGAVADYATLRVDDRALAPRAAHNRLMMKLHRFATALAECLERQPGAPGEREVAFLARGVADEEVWFQMRWKEAFYSAWLAGTVLVMDATANVREVRAFLPELVLSEVEVAVPPGAVEAIQYAGENWSQKRILEIVADPEKVRNVAERIEVALGRVYGLGAIVEGTRIDLLFACQLALRTALEKHFETCGGIPAGLEFVHFNGSTRGNDRWQGIAGLINAGRAEPPPYGIEDIVGVVEGLTPELTGDFVRADAIYESEDPAMEFFIPEGTIQHPDEVAEEYRKGIVGSELAQTYGRGRPIRRGPEKPLRVEVWGKDPVPGVPIKQVDTRHRRDERVDPWHRAAARGVFPLPGSKGAFTVLSMATGRSVRTLRKAGDGPKFDALSDAPLPLRDILFKGRGASERTTRDAPSDWLKVSIRLTTTSRYGTTCLVRATTIDEAAQIAVAVLGCPGVQVTECGLRARSGARGRSGPKPKPTPPPPVSAFVTSTLEAPTLTARVEVAPVEAADDLERRLKIAAMERRVTTAKIADLQAIANRIGLTADFNDASALLLLLQGNGFQRELKRLRRQYPRLPGMSKTGWERAILELILVTPEARLLLAYVDRLRARKACSSPSAQPNDTLTSSAKVVYLNTAHRGAADVSTSE